MPTPARSQASPSLALAHVLTLASACDPVLPVTAPPQGEAARELTLIVTPDDRGASVVRLALDGDAASSLAPADVWLVEGPVTDVSLGRWGDGDVPKTVEERRVATTNFAEAGALRLIPHVPLALAEEHTVIARFAEEASEPIAWTFWTSEDAQPPAVRLWPPPDVQVRSAHALFCATEPGMFSDAAPAVTLEPLGPTGALVRLGDGCVAFVPDAGGPTSGLFHAPRAWGGLDLDPAPLRLGSTAEAVPLGPPACAAAEVAVGPLCVEPHDDRASLRAPAAHAVFVASVGQAHAIVVADADAPTTFELRGLTPSSSSELVVRWFSPAETGDASTTIVTVAPRAHVDLAEVLADPNGPEPAQEWVELHNDGLAATDLADWVLADTAGEVPLPSFVLAPGARVLLVSEGFVDVSLDVEGVLVLPSLGGNGLSNAGEALTLRDAAGVEVSTFPASPKPKAGLTTSLVRLAGGARAWVRTDPTPLAENALGVTEPGG